MRCKFSEFTYGFAVTHEIVTALKAELGPIAPPMLPNLQAEGSLGYDVRMEGLEGWTWLVQYKVPEHLVRRSALEWKEFGSEYFRFKTRDESQQHELLLALEAESVFNIVEYCSPAFARGDELSVHFKNGSIEGHSLKIRPSQIGAGPHTVSYDANLSVVVHSTPQRYQASDLWWSSRDRDASLTPRETGRGRLTAESISVTFDRLLGAIDATAGRDTRDVSREITQQSTRPSSGRTPTDVAWEQLSTLTTLTLGAQLLFLPTRESISTASS